MITYLPAGPVELINWNIIKFDMNDGKAEIFIGDSVFDGISRLSTKIETFDKATGEGKTQSGSTYNVHGEPSMPSGDALYVAREIVGKELVDMLLSGDSEIISFKYLI